MAHEPRFPISSVLCDGGSVKSWACLAASGTGSLVFIDDMTAERSSRKNFAMVGALLSA